MAQLYFILIDCVHVSLQSLADRIKIARKGKGVDINLSVQYILNCGGNMAGSCHGGSHSGVYQMIKTVSAGLRVSYMLVNTHVAVFGAPCNLTQCNETL